MKQVLQNLATGETQLADVPRPHCGAGAVLIATRHTVISAGTERAVVEFGQSSLIGKARQQPDKVKMVLDKARTDGVVATYEAVTTKLGQPLALGYCNVGEVVAVGPKVSGFAVGDRVASNGKHAEFVAVSENLVAKVPDAVPDEAAAFTVLGAVALQSVRLAQPTLGETFAVSGLGLIGLLAVQILRANGCKVLALDFDPSRLALAKSFGATAVNLGTQDPAATALRVSGGHGIDGVIIAASTKSSAPIHQAADMCRKRGRIVMVGVTGMELSRADFYEKELSFQVSCSYGPGRYDPAYEGKGLDYPIGFVRWTEQRNFEAVLALMAAGQIRTDPLVTHRFVIADAVDAFRTITDEPSALGVVLTVSHDNSSNANGANTSSAQTVALPATAKTSDAQPSGTAAKGVVGVIGSGNYAGAVLVPAFQKAGAKLHTIASSAGVSGYDIGRKFGFRETTTDANAVIAHPDIDTVVVATRHDSHAEYVLTALHAGKSVFVEKPLALRHDELEAIKTQAAEAAGAVLMVGFNRRFSPYTEALKAALDEQPAPKAMVMSVNAGAITADHWTQDAQVGGGRILGEACHFIDLLRHLAGAPIVSHTVTVLNAATRDTVTISLSFADGSTGTVHYFANGHKAIPKERLEVFCGGKVFVLDNFRALRSAGAKVRMKGWKQDKGQLAACAAFLAAVRGERGAPIAADELFEVARVTIEAAAAAAQA